METRNRFKTDGKYRNMKVWLPQMDLEGGASVYMNRLTNMLCDLGYEVEVTHLSRNHQVFPYFLKWVKPLVKPDIVIADVFLAAMFKGVAKVLIVIEHHCVFDPEYTPYRSLVQSAVHEILWRRYERNSLQAADAVVCVSNYTAKSVQQVFGELPVHTIPNSVETDFFCPNDEAAADHLDGNGLIELLYVGNLNRRKGVDFFPEIMSKLGSGYCLRYTSDTNGNDMLSNVPNTVALGRLSNDELLVEFRRATIFLFPTRFEGFGYAPAEALSCGTPVISSQCSSLPEVVSDGEDGLLCQVGDIDCYVGAIRRLASDHGLRNKMKRHARKKALERFSMRAWSAAWSSLLNDLT